MTADVYLTTNFKLSEFQCHCYRCAGNPMRPATHIETVRAIQRARTRYGKPFLITRGVSCAPHNADVGGAEDSRHLPEHADAADIGEHDDREKWKIVAACMAEHLSVRVYDDHIHVDDRPGGPIFIGGPKE